MTRMRITVAIFVNGEDEADEIAAKTKKFVRDTFQDKNLGLKVESKVREAGKGRPDNGW